MEKEKKGPGRPVIPGCKRQELLAFREMKRKAGIEIKPGRPKKIKTT